MFKHYLMELARHGRIDPVEYYVSDEYRVVYVENAKVACTAIKQLLYPDAGYSVQGQDAFHAMLRPQAAYRIPDHARDYLCFSIFRDPLARLLSTYRDKILGAGAETAPGIFHTPFHRAIFVLFAGDDITRPGTDFGSFAAAVAMVPDRLRDRHIALQRPVYAAVTSAANHFVGRVEDLSADWQELRERTGLPALPHLNSSRQSPVTLVEPGPAARAAVARAYAADYKSLGYVAA